MIRIKYNKERMRKEMKRLADGVAKSICFAIPIIVSSVMDNVAKQLDSPLSNEMDISDVDANYASAIRAIARSDMSSYYQNRAIQSVSKYGTKEYYAAIEQIALSASMSSYYRCESIEHISK